MKLKVARRLAPVVLVSALVLLFFVRFSSDSRDIDIIDSRDIDIKIHGPVGDIDSREIKIHDGDIQVHDGDIQVHDGDIKIHDGDIKIHDGDTKIHGGDSRTFTSCNYELKLSPEVKAAYVLGIRRNESTQNSYTKDKFSIIIPTYKRVKLLTRVLNNYCRLSSHIDLIIVVWNDLNSEIPSNLTQLRCDVRILWKKETTNSLNNRFLPYPEIRTEAVLSADDDLLVSHQDLLFQFQSWQRFKDHLVGFAARRHEEIPRGSGHYQYIKKVSREDPRYSFILTTSAMFHERYLTLYQNRIPHEFREFIDKHMNCEDILINAIIAEYLNLHDKGTLNCPALMLEQRDIQLIEKDNVGYKGLWHRKQHKSVREDCLSLIAKHFNGIPFGYSTAKLSSIFPEDPNIPVRLS